MVFIDDVVVVRVDKSQLEGFAAIVYTELVFIEFGTSWSALRYLASSKSPVLSYSDGKAVCRLEAISCETITDTAPASISVITCLFVPGL